MHSTASPPSVRNREDHAHGHDHAHVLGHAPVLDIGGEVGAVVVYLATAPSAGEIEACPAGERDRRFHTGVHLRHQGAAHAHVAVFPEVNAGTYELLDEAGGVLTLMEVEGGEVLEVDLRWAASCYSGGGSRYTAT
jgi:hypothetical protein